MDYELSAYKKLDKNLKEIMALSFYGSRNTSEAYIVNNLAHECKKIVQKLESNRKKPK